MSTEIWILLVFAAAAASALITFFLARRGAPTRKQLNDLETELETARNNAKQVEGRVSEHFERSAVLFGHLAKDYKAFLDHYSDSAQALGLSEGRARELLEQGYQPLLTHLNQDVVNETEEPAASEPKAAVEDKASVDAASVETTSVDKASVDKASVNKATADKASADKVSVDKVSGRRPAGTVSRTEPPLIRDVVAAPRTAAGVASAGASAEAGTPAAPAASAARPAGETESGKGTAAVRGVADDAPSARVVAVDLSSKSDTDPKADRQAGQG